MFAIAAAVAALTAPPVIDDMKLSRQPDGPAWRSAYPSAAWKAKVGGQGVLDCHVQDDGGLSRCVVISETPQGQGFAKAALKLAPQFRLAQDEVAKLGPDRLVRVPLEFWPPQDGPDWLKKPDARHIAAAYPVEAVRRGVGGKAVVACVVNVRGLLEKCQVASETPEGLGFGPAALLLTPTFEMSRTTKSGRATAGMEVRIPVVFGAPPRALADMTRSVKVISDPPWAAAPTFADVVAAWPQRAPSELDSAQVLLTCDADRDGGLSRCDVVHSEPRDQGFEAAARGLAKTFKMQVAADEAALLRDLRVNLPIHFTNPAKAQAPRTISRPTWLTTVDGAQAQAVYPAEAIDKGVTTGLGVAQCLVAADGSLADCKVGGENPAGLGFGQSALLVAPAMRMNPWAVDGTPTQGATVRLPVRFNYEKPESAPTP